MSRKYIFEFHKLFYCNSDTIAKKGGGIMKKRIIGLMFLALSLTILVTSAFVYDHASQTIQYHFHGLYRSQQGYNDHGPLHQNNVINQHSINEYRQLNQNHTPIIFEIYHNPTINLRASFEQNLAACLTAKSQLTTL